VAGHHTIDLIIVGVAVLAVTGVIFLARRQTAKLERPGGSSLGRGTECSY
jgi:hypothetical protein